MQYTFSAEFLKILPPATNFGEAWENLCLTLLRSDSADNTIMRLAPPDRGVDIFWQRTGAAYQCKSNERGIFGTIEPQECVTSLAHAVAARGDICWKQYFVAVNAPLSGIGISKVLDFASSNGIERTAIEILSHEYWSSLCSKHKEVITPLFDYRVFVSELEVVDMMRKARYYDRYIMEAEHSMREHPLQVSVGNNRTPIELVLEFSADLTIKQLLDVVRVRLGISLDWANFPDLGTSCGPSLFLTVDRVQQPFKLKLSELNQQQLAKLKLWIKLTWKDELQKDRAHYDGSTLSLYLASPSDRNRPASMRERGATTLQRMEFVIQAGIWRSLMRT